MSSRNALLAAAYAVIGLAFTAYEFPQLRAVQILLPFAAGVLAGTHLGRAWPGFKFWRARASRPNASA